MGLRYAPHTGHLSNLIETLNRALGQYQRYYHHFKIGLTTNPEARWWIHQQDGWLEMVVVYETTSVKYAREAERWLVEYGWERDYIAESWNEVSGGGGLHPWHDWYFIYIILA